MDKEYFNKVVELGKEATKNANKTNMEFFDNVASLDLSDDLEMLIFRNKKATMNANNTLANGCRRIANKQITEYIKSLKEASK